MAAPASAEVLPATDPRAVASPVPKRGAKGAVAQEHRTVRLHRDAI
jgi:hypothetical protein